MPVPAGFPIDLIEAERDFADIRGEMAALPPEKFRPINVDVTTAAIMGLVAAQKLAPLRERMARLPEFEIRSLDRLPKYARAAWFAY